MNESVMSACWVGGCCWLGEGFKNSKILLTWYVHPLLIRFYADRHAIFNTDIDKKIKIMNFQALPVMESRFWWRTTIEMSCLWLKWGVSEVCAMSCSGDMTVSWYLAPRAGPFSIKKRQWPKIQWRWPQKILKKNQNDIYIIGTR